MNERFYEATDTPRGRATVEMIQETERHLLRHRDEYNDIIDNREWEAFHHPKQNRRDFWLKILSMENGAHLFDLLALYAFEVCDLRTGWVSDGPADPEKVLQFLEQQEVAENVKKI